MARTLCVVGGEGHAFAVTSILEGSDIDIASIFDDSPGAVARGLGRYPIRLGISQTYDASVRDEASSVLAIS